jgi:hypothetical protein
VTIVSGWNGNGLAAPLILKTTEKRGGRNLCSAKADAHNEVTQRSNLADDSQTNYMETVS